MEYIDEQVLFISAFVTNLKAAVMLAFFLFKIPIVPLSNHVQLSTQITLSNFLSVLTHTDGGKNSTSPSCYGKFIFLKARTLSVFALGPWKKFHITYQRSNYCHACIKTCHGKRVMKNLLVFYNRCVSYTNA